MAKRLTHDLTYDAPVADVAAMLRDPAFREEVCARQRVLRAEVGVEGDGPASVITVERVQAARGIPSFAQKVVGDEITIVQRETWTSAEHGELHIAIPGKPGEGSGTVRLEETGGRTVETVDLTLKVSVPLVGGKLEGLVSDLLVKALETENAVGRDYLAR